MSEIGPETAILKCSKLIYQDLIKGSALWIRPLARHFLRGDESLQDHPGLYQPLQDSVPKVQWMDWSRVLAKPENSKKNFWSCSKICQKEDEKYY